MSGDPGTWDLAVRVGAALHAAGRTVVTAESCTGGWVAKALTDVPGSSAWFACGYVTYSNAAKERDLGVGVATLERFGAVSEEVVREMATGALARAGADVAVAVSGIAGPDGGTPGKPVGLVWFAVAARRGGGLETRAGQRQFGGDRAAVRRAAVQHALGLILSVETAAAGQAAQAGQPAAPR